MTGAGAAECENATTARIIANELRTAFAVLPIFLFGILLLFNFLFVSIPPLSMARSSKNPLELDRKIGGRRNIHAALEFRKSSIALLLDSIPPSNAP
jgi:magnesium-transporting ATPase (P-type)